MANYCVIFKAGENLGHTSTPQIEELSLEFFKYLFTFVPDEKFGDQSLKNDIMEIHYIDRNLEKTMIVRN